MEKARLGRPRSEKSREAILEATRELLAVGGGAGLSMESVARRAGVGKPTLYRWWPSLADIVLEALRDQAEEEIIVPSTGAWAEDLRLFLRNSMAAIVAGGGVHLRFLMAQAQRDDGFRDRFRENFVSKRRFVLRSILLRANGNGQGGGVHDPDLLVDMIFGAMWYRLLTNHAPIDVAFADDLCSAAVRVVVSDES